MKVLQLFFVVSFGFNCLQASGDVEALRAVNNYSPASLEFKRQLIGGLEIFVPSHIEKTRVKDSNYLYSKEARAKLEAEANEDEESMNWVNSETNLKYSDSYLQCFQLGVRFIRNLAKVPNEEGKQKLIADTIAKNKEIRIRALGNSENK